MSLGAPSQVLENRHSLVGGSESRKAGSGLEAPRGEEGQQEATDPSKSSPVNVCSAQKCLWLLGTFGVLLGASLVLWCGAKHLRKPLPLQESLPLQDTEAFWTRCKAAEEDQGEPFGQTSGKKVSFRIHRGNFLLEVLLEGWPSWLLVCHESWDISLGMWICRHLGHLRLTHHKGVNLTDVTLNGSQEFAQVLPDWKGSMEAAWQIRKRCPLGRIVALKCLECGTHAKAPPLPDKPLRPWPWQVNLFLDAKRVCTGSLLSQEWIVTAAHCVHSARRLHLPIWVAFPGFEVQTGLKEQKGTSVEKVLPHPDYSSSSRDHDIAVLKLKEPLNFSDAVQAICLPRYHQDLPHSNTCWISGQAHSTKKPVTLISPQTCNSSCGYAELTPQMLCASYRDGNISACQGGEPLVCQQEDTWHLAGIGCRCAEPGQPGIYTRVAEYLDWIYQAMESNEW